MRVLSSLSGFRRSWPAWPAPATLLAGTALIWSAACGGSAASDSPTSPSTSFNNSPCSVSGTLQLSEAQAARVDCGNGGTTLTLSAAGASYLVVAEFATDQGSPSTLVSYTLAANAAAAPSVAPSTARAENFASPTGPLPPFAPNALQARFDAALRSSAVRMQVAGAFSETSARVRAAPARTSPAFDIAPPAVGSLRNFHVRSSLVTGKAAWKTAIAQLRYAGKGVLLYVDTLAPPGGFSVTQLQQFGQYFDQTLYTIDTAAFGQPSDIDGNGRVIMLMSPVVNADTPAAECNTTGFVQGFFDPVDFDGPSDPNSNQGEVFYSIVPDPFSTASCAHSVADVQNTIPATFLHELQHLIDFSQHVIVHGGAAQPGWLDEGMSIVAEELGSVYYEAQCPQTACRTDPSQLFPDSSQGFVLGFLYDSYQYGLEPDTATITLHSDADGGFAWRGGDWALMHWLGDQMGPGVYRKLESTSSTGAASIESVAGQPFPALFSDFELSLFTDSLPGLPRATAPAADRFTTRNLRQIWARWYTTHPSSAVVPYPYPLRPTPLLGGSPVTAKMPAGTGAFYRLDTPSTSTTVTIQFAAPNGGALSASLKPQISIFRLPTGQ